MRISRHCWGTLYYSPVLKGLQWRLVGNWLVEFSLDGSPDRSGLGVCLWVWRTLSSTTWLAFLPLVKSASYLLTISGQGTQTGWDTVQPVRSLRNIYLCFCFIIHHIFILCAYITRMSREPDCSWFLMLIILEEWPLFWRKVHPGCFTVHPLHEERSGVSKEKEHPSKRASCTET